MSDREVPRQTPVDPTMDFASRGASRATGTEVEGRSSAEGGWRLRTIEGSGVPSEQSPGDRDSDELPLDERLLQREATLLEQHSAAESPAWWDRSADGRGEGDGAAEPESDIARPAGLGGSRWKNWESTLSQAALPRNTVRRWGRDPVEGESRKALSVAPTELEIERLPERSDHWPLLGLGLTVGATVAGVVSLMSGPTLQGAPYLPAAVASSTRRQATSDFTHTELAQSKSGAAQPPLVWQATEVAPPAAPEQASEAAPAVQGALQSATATGQQLRERRWSVGIGGNSAEAEGGADRRLSHGPGRLASRRVFASPTSTAVHVSARSPAVVAPRRGVAESGGVAADPAGEAGAEGGPFGAPPAVASSASVLEESPTRYGKMRQGKPF